MAGLIEKNLRKAKVLIKKNALSEAAEIYMKILQKFPNNHRAKQGLQELRLGIASIGGKKGPPQELQQEVINLFNQGKFQIVIHRLKQILGSFPNSYSLWSLMGASYINTNQFNEAIECCRRSVQLNPNSPECFFHIGTAAKELGKIDLAISNYKRAILINENHFLAYNRLGIIFIERGLHQEAIQMFEKATLINPRFPDAFNNLGAYFMNIGEYANAVETLEKAILVKSDYTEAYYNLGLTLVFQNKLEQAIEALEKALMLKPDYEAIRAHKLLQQARICDWTSIMKDEKVIKQLGVVEQGISPFSILSFEDSPSRHCLRSELHAKIKFPPRNLKPLTKPSRKPSRLKIGYFSADFHNHATMYLISKVLEVHDKKHFEIYAYSFGPDDSGPI